MLAKRIATILGIGFIAIALIGFLKHDLLGMHLSMTHHIIHLVTGLVSLWIGLKGSVSAAKTFCIIFGLVYAGLGIAGFVLGTQSSPTPGVPGPADAKLLKVIPGLFEVGTMDHIVHILLGATYVIGGLATRVVYGGDATARRV
ncbi:MAG TPA: DUF4383 domain-containing protein [Thermoanaerobaculia bacterium]|jgi:hypothetical protein